MRPSLLVFALAAVSISQTKPPTQTRSNPLNDARLLIGAATDGKLRQVKHYLALGVPVDAQTGDGASALYAAAVSDHTDIVRLLLKSGAKPNGLSQASAPLLSTHHCGPEILKLLIDAGANIEVRSNQGWTPLFECAANGKTENVRILLAKKANPNIVDPKGDTPLHWAAGNVQIVKMLVRAGAKVNCANRDGETPLMKAALSCDRSSAQALLDAGADPKAIDIEGRTAKDLVRYRAEDWARSAKAFAQEKPGKDRFMNDLNRSNVQGFLRDAAKARRMLAFLNKIH